VSNPANGLRLRLPVGWIEGVTSPTACDTGSPALRIFKGIPYAAAPVGERRWQAPQPVSPWVGVRPCDRFGPVAAQAGLPGSTGHAGDLDCLSLNVWCPPAGDGPWPVMLWIPGGGFMRGGASDPLYDGSAMARQGIVFVSINYRLGVDGFMHFDDAVPNRGLQDQLAALRWVQEHIALFGGDPRRVTVAGVSAGAGAITHLMGLSGSEALFERVILQSPSMQSHSLEDAQRIRHALAGVLGVAPTRQALAAVPLALLTRALASFMGNEVLKKQWGLRPKNYFPVRPVVDGHLIEMEPLPAIEKRLRSGGAKRAVLLGSNAEEMRFYLVPNGEIDWIDEARVRTVYRGHRLVSPNLGPDDERLPGHEPANELGRCAEPHPDQLFLRRAHVGLGKIAAPGQLPHRFCTGSNGHRLCMVDAWAQPTPWKSHLYWATPIQAGPRSSLGRWRHPIWPKTCTHAGPDL